MFDEVQQRYRELIIKDALVQVEGGLRFDELTDAWRINARQIVSLDAVRERLARQLVLSWPGAAGAAGAGAAGAVGAAGAAGAADAAGAHGCSRGWRRCCGMRAAANVRCCCAIAAARPAVS